MAYTDHDHYIIYDIVFSIYSKKEAVRIMWITQKDEIATLATLARDDVTTKKGEPYDH